MTDFDSDEYGLSNIPKHGKVAAPELPYRPPVPRQYRPAIGLIGAGGISEYHLRAYRAMGLDVKAICDVRLEQAARRRDEFYPDARVFQDYEQLLGTEAIEVVDIATHPAERVAIIEAALRSKKHVLSQKPFVTDVDTGQRLVSLADQNGVKLAVNQNGRWSPHLSYIKQAIKRDVIGTVSSVDFSMQWDHTWTAGTPFEEIHHLILYDFAVHWFDITTAFMGQRTASRVFASTCRAAYQEVKPPFLAQVVVDYVDAQVRMTFNANASHGQEDRSVVVGQLGTLRAFGPGVNKQTVHLWTAKGYARPELTGTWFDSGFQGTMGELLCAIEEGREPENNAKDNLRSLELCFAATASADRGEPIAPGAVRQLPKA